MARARDFLADVAVRGFETGVGSLSEPAARRAGRRLALMAHRPLRIRRRVVERQIADSFPDRDAVWVRDTARACYLHFGEEIAALARPTPRRVERMLARAHDPAGLYARQRHLFEGGSGAIIVTGHIGNWELAGAYLARAGVPVTAVVRRQRGAVDRRFQRIRRAMGLEIVYQEEPARILVQALRAGRTLTLVADQHAARGGAAVPFLGRPASTFRGPARLAIACHVPLFFGALLKDGDDYRVALERVDGERGRTDDIDLTRSWVEKLEKLVLRHPHQYFWFHRRWKSAAPGTSATTRAYEPGTEESA
jgi:KDO2-lipid IV(A) lauroyltransferase